MYLYFSSGRSCSYNSVGPPGGGWCTVCSHLVFEEVLQLAMIAWYCTVAHNWRVWCTVQHCMVHIPDFTAILRTWHWSREWFSWTLFYTGATTYMIIVHLLDIYLCRTTINVIAMTCFLCVQVHSQNEEPNTEVTGRIVTCFYLRFTSWLLHVLHFHCAKCRLSNSIQKLYKHLLLFPFLSGIHYVVHPSALAIYI